MKTMNQLLVLLVCGLFLHGTSFAEPAKTEENLAAQTVVKTALISITVPQGWSYTLLTPWGNSTRSSQHLVITPTSPVNKSLIGITISDQIPHSKFNAQTLAGLKNPPLPVQSANWGGKTWNWVEETHTSNYINMYHWVADTPLKDRDLEVTVNFPVAEEAKFRPLFTQILQSIHFNQ